MSLLSLAESQCHLKMSGSNFLGWVDNAGTKFSKNNRDWSLPFTFPSFGWWLFNGKSVFYVNTSFETWDIDVIFSNRLHYYERGDRFIKRAAWVGAGTRWPFFKVKATQLNESRGVSGFSQLVRTCGQLWSGLGRHTDVLAGLLAGLLPGRLGFGCCLCL